MLKYTFLSLILGIVFCAKLQVSQDPHIFEISVLYTGAVSWTKNGVVYNHLQQLSPTCPDGATPVSQGPYKWACGPFDTLLNAAPNCTGNQILKYVNGAFVCAKDNDVLGGLTCSSGDMVAWVSGAWTCKADSNEYTSLPSSCAQGDYLIHTGSAWACNATIPNSDVANIVCANNQVLKFDGSAPNKFVCGSDLDENPNCAVNEIPYYNGTGWACQLDTDTALSLATSGACTPATPYPKFRNGNWTCEASFVDFTSKKRSSEATEAFNAEIAVLSAIFKNVGSSGSGLSFFAKWGTESDLAGSFAPAIMPTNGTVHSIRLYMDRFTNPAVVSNKVLTISLLVNNVVAGSYNVTVAPGAITKQSFTSPQFSVPFTAGSTLSAVVSTVSPALTYANGQYAFYFYVQI